jgi:hypothetical protein
MVSAGSEYERAVESEGDDNVAFARIGWHIWLSRRCPSTGTSSSTLTSRASLYADRAATTPGVARPVVATANDRHVRHRRSPSGTSMDP